MLCASVGWPATTPTRLNPAKLAVANTIDKRFQSYNIEMLEVTGGRFWKPYKDVKPGIKGANAAADLYQYRPAIDLSQARLRKLAGALGPAYLRVSGTWANSVYFHDSDDPAPASPPEGFTGVLTRQQWKGVVEFARAANAELAVSFAASDGTRDGKGVWTPAQARSLIAYTKTLGGHIAAAEFVNEPNMADHGGFPNGYDAAAYGRDFRLFRRFFKGALPDALLLGPGSVMEGGTVPIPVKTGLKTEKLMEATGPAVDAFSYHMYAALSQRCGGAMPGIGITPGAALSEEWLSRPDKIHAFYQGLRDRFEPGMPMWLTETADAGCGGNPWASTFLDTFRYVDQHARLAEKGVQVIAHNTLAASDYGLLDEGTLEPRPNYWAALLWHKLIGTVVLRTNAPESAGSPRLYAHCLNGVPGGVAVLAINTDLNAWRRISIPQRSEQYMLTAPEIQGTRVELNGAELKLGPGDSLPPIVPVPVPPGEVKLPPASITFLAIPDAPNAGCR